MAHAVERDVEALRLHGAKGEPNVLEGASIGVANETQGQVNLFLIDPTGTGNTTAQCP